MNMWSLEGGGGVARGLDGGRRVKAVVTFPCLLAQNTSKLTLLGAELPSAGLVRFVGSQAVINFNSL